MAMNVIAKGGALDTSDEHHYQNKTTSCLLWPRALGHRGLSENLFGHELSGAVGFQNTPFLATGSQAPWSFREPLWPRALRRRGLSEHSFSGHGLSGTVVFQRTSLAMSLETFKPFMFEDGFGIQPKRHSKHHQMALAASQALA
jgi:hypothetical protein